MSLDRNCFFNLSDNNEFEVSEAAKRAFEEFGFIMVRGLLTNEELCQLRKEIDNKDSFVHKNVCGYSDGQGGVARLCLWNHPGEGITGMIGRCEKIVTTFEKLLGGEVYHYHSKLMMKDAFEGGAHVWHQDYGYWYHNGCLWPNMGTVFIAFDKATMQNGCLRIIPRSHKLGRIDHIKCGQQAGANLERVNYILETLGGEVPVEMEPGDGLFFHCNLLHTSAQNKSADRRWALLAAYNRADNDPVIEHHHPQYTPLKKVPNSAILEYNLMSNDQKDFLKANNEDISIQVLSAREMKASSQEI